MWRAAAAVLVVAAGSLVVVRNTSNRSAATEFSQTVGKAEAVTVLPSVPAAASMDSSSQTAVAAGSLQRNSVPTQKTTVKRAATQEVADSKQALAVTTPQVADLGKAPPPSSQPSIRATDNSVATAPTASDSAEKVSPASGYANVQPLSSRIMIRGMTALSTDRDSIGALGPLKVVGRPRQIGAKITLYEVTPTDTVTLTEFMNVQLESVVVAGRLEGQATGKAAAAPSPRADAAVAGRQDAQREAGGVAGAERARSRSVPAPGTVGTANGVTTVTWTDPGSGNVLKLSGRLPLAQLQQIKIRIERERAAAAAKKNP